MIEADIIERMERTLEHSRVFPHSPGLLADQSPEESASQEDDPDGRPTKPSVTIHMLDGSAHSGFHGQTGHRTDTFGVKILASTPEEAQRIRDVFCEEFRGPAVKGDPGSHTTWRDHGRVILWAEFEVKMFDESLVNDPHDQIFVQQGVLTITHEPPGD